MNEPCLGTRRTCPVRTMFVLALTLAGPSACEPTPKCIRPSTPYIPEGVWDGELTDAVGSGSPDPAARFEMGDGQLILTYTVDGEAWRATYRIGEVIDTYNGNATSYSSSE